VFLLAWIFLAAAVASLYAGLSDEGRSFLYLSMAASAVTVVLVIAQLRRGSPSRMGGPSPASGEPGGVPSSPPGERAGDHGRGGPDGPSSPGP
jgi:hypothetical protein